MKELSIEDKAKRYDELKVKAQELTEDGYIDKLALLDLFPELKESDEERIREWLICTLKSLNNSPVQIDGAYEMMLPAIAWLEKQGEKGINGNKREIPFSEQKPDTDFSDLRTWKYIVDAVWTEKEGIGQYLDSPFTEEVAKKLQKRFGNIEQKPADKVEPKFKVGDKIVSAFNTPYYITKVCDRYYLTDVGRIIMFNAQDNFELAEQNPAWSDEDKKNSLEIKCLIGSYRTGADEYRLYSWIDSFKDRVQPRQKQEWSEKDETVVNSIISFCDFKVNIEQHNEGVKEVSKKVLSWLNELKSRVQPQSKQEWSEEDKRKIDRIYSILRQAADTHAFSTTCRLIGDKECIELQDFLKSLKERYTLKPSNEQLECLSDAIKHYNSLGYPATKLKELLDDLKKLRDEK